MKRQTQTTGIRNWYGADFLSLQEETFKVLDGFFTQFGSFVLAGCQVTPNGNKYNISQGLVALSGANAEGQACRMVVPFGGVTGVTLPIYLTLGYETDTDTYNDGAVKAIAYNYKAVASTIQPAGDYLKISASNTPCFVDVIQDARHRFITDSERKSWIGKADQADVAGVFKYDYIVDSNAALAALANNPDATSVLIKKGIWQTTGITLHPNTKRIVGESGACINFINYWTGGSCLRYAMLPVDNADYFVQGVDVLISEAEAVGFENMCNITNCVCILHPPGEESIGFKNCKNLSACRTEGYGPGFLSCINLQNCYGKPDPGYTSGIVFQDCDSMIQCDCNGVIYECWNVFMCKSKSYHNSYFSQLFTATYACANTLNGGWNRIVTK